MSKEEKELRMPSNGFAGMLDKEEQALKVEDDWADSKREKALKIPDRWAE